MRSVALLAALAAAVPVSGQSSDALVGSWLGELKVGAVTLRVVLVFAATPEGLVATLDSPDQGAKGIPLPDLDVKLPRVTVGRTGLSFAGQLSADGRSLVGTWAQGGQTWPLVVARLDGAFTLSRPQTPQPPFPYQTQDVSVVSAPGVTLAGTLVLPPGTGPFPAVVLISGSGPNDRDETLFAHKPFLVLADALARAGVASLRYDKRGIGASTGDAATATTADYALDAAAAWTFLDGRPETAPGRVGLVGHSEGGLIAPLVATRNAVAFVVLLAAPAVSGSELLASQGEALAIASGATTAQAAEGRRINTQLYAAAVGADVVHAREAVKGLLTAAGFDGAAADQTTAQLTSPWMRAFLQWDPVPSLRQLSVPVLALNGTKDLQVPVGPNFAALEQALTAAGARHRLVALDGLNHLFQHAGSGLPAEYGQITETMAREAIDRAVQFVLDPMEATR